MFLTKEFLCISEISIHEKDILNWFNSIKDKSTLKHLHHVSKKTPIFTYGFEMNVDMWALYTESFGKGIMQKIILNWYEITQKKIVY